MHTSTLSKNNEKLIVDRIFRPLAITYLGIEDGQAHFSLRKGNGRFESIEDITVPTRQGKLELGVRNLKMVITEVSDESVQYALTISRGYVDTLYSVPHRFGLFERIQ